MAREATAHLFAAQRDAVAALRAALTAPSRARGRWVRVAGRIVATRLPEGPLIPEAMVIKRDPSAASMERPRNLQPRRVAEQTDS